MQKDFKNVLNFFSNAYSTVYDLHCSLKAEYKENPVFSKVPSYTLENYSSLFTSFEVPLKTQTIKTFNFIQNYYYFFWDEINKRIGLSNNHILAHHSRALITLNKIILDLDQLISDYSLPFKIDDHFLLKVKEIDKFLNTYQGSKIPDGFEKLTLYSVFMPIFSPLYEFSKINVFSNDIISKSLSLIKTSIDKNDYSNAYIELYRLFEGCLNHILSANDLCFDVKNGNLNNKFKLIKKNILESEKNEKKHCLLH